MPFNMSPLLSWWRRRRVLVAFAVAIAANAKTPQAASDRIAQIARERWRRNGPMQDDITAVVVGLN